MSEQEELDWTLPMAEQYVGEVRHLLSKWTAIRFGVNHQPSELRKAYEAALERLARLRGG